MAKTAAERKRDQRRREKALGIKPMILDLATSERDLIAERAAANGFDDQTEFVLSLVYQERDKSQAN